MPGEFSVAYRSLLRLRWGCESDPMHLPRLRRAYLFARSTLVTVDNEIINNKKKHTTRLQKYSQSENVLKLPVRKS